MFLFFSGKGRDVLVDLIVFLKRIGRSKGSDGLVDDKGFV